MHEMRHIGPEGLIAGHEFEGIAKAFALHRHPQRVDVFRGQFALGAGGMQLAFEIIEGDLAHDRVDHVLDLAGQKRLALGLVGGSGQQRAEGQHLAKDRGRLGQRQRSRGQKLALTGGHALVDAVAQLMRQRHHVARLAQIVQQHIGMHRRHRRMRECAGGLAGFHAGINPALVKEGLGQFGQFRRKAGIGVQHRGAGLGPGDQARGLGRQRGVAVPDLQLVETQPFGLEPVIAMREPRIGGGHRVPERLDHFGLDMV